MNIYRITQEANVGYDTYDSAIVIANNEEKARKIHPSSNLHENVSDWYWETTWTNPHNVIVEWICEYNGEYQNGTVLCASFNAG